VVIPFGSVADPDPTYEAYLRALGFQGETSQKVATQKTADVNARAALEIPELGTQYQREQESVNADALGRGVWSSGEHDRALAEAGHDYQYRLGSMEMTQAQSLGDIQLALAQQQAELEGQKAVAAARHWGLVSAANEAQTAGATGGVVVPSWAQSVPDVRASRDNLNKRFGF
jgi:hypothetical protein